MSGAQGNSRPKVVVLASRFPFPLAKGDKLRLYHHLRLLSDSLDLYLIVTCESLPSPQELAELKPYCKRVTAYTISETQRKRAILLNLWSEMPLQVRYFYNKHVHLHILRDIHQIKPDHIHCFLLRMAPYLDEIEHPCTKSIDFMDSMKLNDLGGQYLRGFPKRLLRNRERANTARYEQRIAEKITNSTIISRRDREMFDPKVRDNMTIVSNGVDVDFYHPGNRKNDPEYDIVFCGNLSYQPNLEAIQYLFERIIPLLSGMKILIAGADLKEDRAEHLRQLFDAKNNGHNQLHLLGYQEDLRSVYFSGRCMLVPIFSGSGQQNRVLEAMACGIPCITSSFVATGLNAPEKDVLLVANDPPAFVSHLKDLLSHPGKRKTLASSARDFIERNFSWSVNTMLLQEMIQNAITNE